MSKPTTQQVSVWVAQTIASPYFAWMIVNIIGWSFALYAVALCVRFLGVIGAPVGAILAGLIIGGGQAWALSQLTPIPTRRWLGYSTLGTLLGALPIALFFLWVLLIAIIGINSVLLILGGLFGLILGGIQASVLRPYTDAQVAWWALANGLAGALCAPLSLTGGYFWLPVFCTLGPVTFGLITAWGLRYILHETEI